MLSKSLYFSQVIDNGLMILLDKVIIRVEMEGFHSLEIMTSKTALRFYISRLCLSLLISVSSSPHLDLL